MTMKICRLVVASSECGKGMSRAVRRVLEKDVMLGLYAQLRHAVAVAGSAPVESGRGGCRCAH
jgi:hypothetical protein